MDWLLTIFPNWNADGFIATALQIVLILLLGLLAQKIIRIASRLLRRRVFNKLSGKYSSRVVQANSMVSLITALASAVVWTIVIISILSELGLDTGALLASVSIVGLAISFGSQELAKDIISGTFMITENQFNTGDLIEVMDKKGVVKSIGPRTITLQSEKNQATYIIRNSLINVVTRYDTPVEPAKAEKPPSKRAPQKRYHTSTRTTSKTAKGTTAS